MNPIISVINISKTYRSGDIETKALQGVSLEVKRGEFVMITGRNGSGKSTLLHQLGLLDIPDSGEIIINNKNVTKLSEHERSDLRLRYLGYIFQEYALMSELTAIENVMLPALPFKKTSICQKRAGELLAQVDLESKWDHLPSQLSGGEQQKVAIARALINDPVVIYADEPTANLDSVAAADVMRVFKKINEDGKRTILMITHEQEETVYANRIIRLADGRIV